MRRHHLEKDPIYNTNDDVNNDFIFPHAPYDD